MYLPILINRGECLKCGDVIVSESVHSYVTCSCGEVSVDGGREYLRRSARDFSNFKDTTVYTITTAELEEIIEKRIEKYVSTLLDRADDGLAECCRQALQKMREM